MTTENTLNCSFSSWYDRFKDHTIKSRILQLPQALIDYLNADGIILPESNHGINSRAGTEWDSDDDELKSDWAEGVNPSSKAPQFPEFDAQIRSAISALGGTVFPKLNWSSPKDAAWIALNNSLECKTPADIYLLLKSSNFIAHDLSNPFGLTEAETGVGQASPKFQYELILRRWHKLDPGGEFRCFVRNQQIIAICQRHYKNFFEHIKKEEGDIIGDILTFYSSLVKDNFPGSNYVFDVYRKEKGKVYVLDFNPYCHVTDSLMLSWDELDQMNPELDLTEPIFRCVEHDTGITSSPYQSSAVPQDFIDLTTGMDPNKLIDFLQMKIQSQEEETSSDEDNDEVEEKVVEPKSSISSAKGKIEIDRNLTNQSS